MKKVISVVGARPNFMKIAPIDRALRSYSEKIRHIIVHTGQHYDSKMSDAFFSDLNLPNPDYFLGIGSGSHAEQTGRIMIEFEKICLEEKPDLVIVVGDVNSTLAAGITAVKLGIKLAHVESGLRSFDREMPEEINRIVTDSIADYLFITEKSGYDNLRREGKNEDFIYFVGNTMIDSLLNAINIADKSNIISDLDIADGEYILCTLHRPSNVDTKEKLEEFIEIFEFIAKTHKVVFPIHPRTRKNIDLYGLSQRVGMNKNLKLIEPLGYLDFLKLMKHSKFVVTDSGGIQEETTVLGVRCLTLRTSTERPITCDIGTNILVKPEKERIIENIEHALNEDTLDYDVPTFWDGKAGERIAEIINKLLS